MDVFMHQLGVAAQGYRDGYVSDWTHYDTREDDRIYKAGYAQGEDEFAINYNAAMVGLGGDPFSQARTVTDDARWISDEPGEGRNW